LYIRRVSHLRFSAHLADQVIKFHDVLPVPALFAARQRE
jgi:hypothetical protein